MRDFPIIEKFGGRKMFAEAMVTRGHRCCPGTMWHWRFARQISGKVVIDIMLEADARGIAYDGGDFVLPDGEDGGAT